MSGEPFEMDPEVLADLRLRERTARERSDAGINHLTWKPEQPSGETQCKGKIGDVRCRVMVPITPSDSEFADRWNAPHFDAIRGPKPITVTVLCDACRHHRDGNRMLQNATLDAQLTVAIREFRALGEPCVQDRCISERCRWHQLIALMRKLGNHPDLDGLIAAVTTRLQSKANAAKAPRQART